MINNEKERHGERKKREGEEKEERDRRERNKKESDFFISPNKGIRILKRGKGLKIVKWIKGK